MEAATWAGFAMATLSLAGTVFANINARKLARDKAEYDLLAAKTKLEFDVKVLEIQRDSKHKDDELRELRDELTKCREQHERSEKDRDDLREKIERLETQLAQLIAAK